MTGRMAFLGSAASWLIKYDFECFGHAPEWNKIYEKLKYSLKSYSRATGAQAGRYIHRAPQAIKQAKIVGDFDLHLDCLNRNVELIKRCRIAQEYAWIRNSPDESCCW